MGALVSERDALIGSTSVLLKWDTADNKKDALVLSHRVRGYGSNYIFLQAQS